MQWMARNNSSPWEHWNSSCIHYGLIWCLIRNNSSPWGHWNVRPQISMYWSSVTTQAREGIETSVFSSPTVKNDSNNSSPLGHWNLRHTATWSSWCVTTQGGVRTLSWTWIKQFQDCAYTPSDSNPLTTVWSFYLYTIAYIGLNIQCLSPAKVSRNSDITC